MGRKLSNYYLRYCLLAAILCLCGCGSNTAGSKNIKEVRPEGITYVAEAIPLPEYASLDGACSSGNELYYAAAELDETANKYETSFYTLRKGAAGPEKSFSLTENQRVQSMTKDKEGNIYYLGYEEPPQDSNGSKAVPAPMIYKVNPEGAPILELNLSEYTKTQEQPIVQGLAVDDEKHIVTGTSDQKIYVFNPDGGILFEVKADGMIYDLCSIGGKIFVVHSGIDGMEIREIDVPGKKLSPRLISGIPGTKFRMTAGKEGSLLIASEESVYRHTLESGETVRMFDWQTYDITGITAGIFMSFGENGVLLISRDYTTFPMKAEAAVFREAAEGEEPVKEKTVLTIGIPESFMWTRGDTVSNFNKANPDYKIEIKNYNSDYTRLNAEIIAGQGPDILALPSYRANLLADKGVLEDLKPYFDEDESLNGSDYPENILKAFEIEGHLYVMPVTFRISTIVGKTSILGDRAGWNLEEFIAFAENCPEDTPLFDNTSKSGVLRLLKYGYTKQLVDMNNAEHPLDRELLVKMLEFANRYEDDGQYVHENDKLGSKILNGQVMLPDVIIVGGYDYFGYRSMFGEPVTFIGYPAAEGNGSLITSQNTYAINAGSKYKDVAWEFISSLLSDKGQRLISIHDFPLKTDTLKYFSDYWIDVCTGSIVMSASTIGDSDASSSNWVYYSPTGDTVNEEDVQQIYDLIENADTAHYISPDIDHIIREEAALYFSGAKPVEEVADIIENRIKTYVNENN